MRTHRWPAFTFIEVIMVIGIFTMVATLLSVITLRAMNRRQANTEVEMVLSALSFQQQQASNRVVSNEPTQDYGVFFFAGGYTQFSGSSYEAEDADNQTTNLPSGVTFSTINLPGNSVVFDEATGFVQGYVASQSGVVLTNLAGEQTTLTINRLGVVEMTR